MDRDDAAEGIHLYKGLIEADTTAELLRQGRQGERAARKAKEARASWQAWVALHSVASTDFVRSECRRLFPEVFTQHEELR